MTKFQLRAILAVAILSAAAVVGWKEFRPYQWRVDPAARSAVIECELTRDHSYFWLHAFLKTHRGERHDLEQPVWLETAGGNRLEPAASTFGDHSGSDPRDLWFKFWLAADDLSGPLKLHLNGGVLEIRTMEGVPDLGSAGSRVFTSTRW